MGSFFTLTGNKFDMHEYALQIHSTLLSDKLMKGCGWRGFNPTLVNGCIFLNEAYHNYGVISLQMYCFDTYKIIL